MNTNTVFTTFRAPVNSKPLGEMNLGLMKPGRYSGFDIMEEIVGLNVMIKHSDIIRKASTQVDDDITFSKFGCILTPNGSVIHNMEDPGESGVNITLETNVGNANVRYDYLILEHVYSQVVGGEPPVIWVQQGDNSGNPPTLANPEKQVVIGTFKLNPGAYNYSGITWSPSLVPLPGDMDEAMLYAWLEELITIEYATFTVPGIIALATNAEVLARTNADKAVTPASMMAAKPDTTLPGVVRQATDNEIINNTPVVTTYEAYVTPDHMRKYGRLRDFILYDTNSSIDIPVAWNGKTVVLGGDGGSTPLITFNIPVGRPNNFKVTILAFTQRAKIISAGGITVLTPADRSPEHRALGTPLHLECVIADTSNWIAHGDLKVISLTNSTGLVPMNAAIPYFPISNSLSEFNSTGLGIADNVLGWAICNGQNGTRDLRGRFVIHQDVTDATMDNVGDVGGSKTKTLVSANLPPITVTIPFTIDYPGGSNEFVLGPGNFGNKTYSVGGTSTAFDIMPPFYTTIYIQRIS